MDMSDAINLLTYASPIPNGQTGHATWTIFEAKDTLPLRAWMRSHLQHAGVDPIHLQNCWLTDGNLKQLSDNGILSRWISQYAGQAVFIPAGCAHQVCPS
jgi:lysine-specific demethylase 3